MVVAKVETKNLLIHVAVKMERLDADIGAVQAALEQLSPQDRALLTLFYWDELNLHEIAAAVGCNVNAAKTRLYRARERFKCFYEEDVL